ncbi:hypothetical protein DI383_12795 [Flavobacteriaceae bacterium LYZ1037]|nr:hypothetical protein DI383_12795 [Flavobacteriaceae bacterium LYZ1037]
MSCSTKNEDPVKAIASSEAEITSTEVNLPLNPLAFKEPYNPHSPYHLDLKIEHTETDAQQLVVFITLKGDAHFVSPHAKREFKGKFSMTIDESNMLTTEDHLIEVPQSVEEFDSHHLINGTVNWVRDNTTYKLPIQVISEKDFEVTGLIRFTIEPRCTLEEIPFKVHQKSGILTVELVGGC